MKKPPEETADEKALGRIVAARLREQLQGTASGCPDTETLAAYYERALTDSERVVCENHFLRCLHCQEYLAELARLSDADEAPVLLEDQAAAEAKEVGPSWTFRLAWVAPILIVAIGSAIWFREDIQRMLRRPQETAMKAPEPAPAPETPLSARDRAAGEKQERAKAAERKDLAKTAPPPISALQPTAEKPEGKSPVLSITGAGRESGAAAGTLAPPSARTRVSAAVKRADRVLEYPEEERKAEVVDRAAATARTAEQGPAFARKESSELAGVTIRGAKPKFAPTWRVARRGIIQKADGAGGWVLVPSGVTDDLFDITFAGASAGWAVGHEGTVLRSTDGGNTWNKASPPTNEDLVHVSAQSGREAQVISRSGKSFTTTDGGQTWRITNQ